MKPFIITGTQRIGSATLARAVGYHVAVACGWEWPRKLSWSNRVSACQAALRGNFSELAGKHRTQIESQVSNATTWLGYRSLFRANDKWAINPGMAPSLYLDRFYANLDWWRRESAIHIVHIVRTDHLAWLRSKYVARELRSYHAGQQYPEDFSITIPVGAALRRVRMKVWLDDRLSQLAGTNPYLTVKYEDILQGLATVTEKVQGFLDLDPELMPGDQVKERQSKGVPVEQHVANYVQLRRALVEAGLLEASA